MGKQELKNKLNIFIKSIITITISFHFIPTSLQATSYLKTKNVSTPNNTNYSLDLSFYNKINNLYNIRLDFKTPTFKDSFNSKMSKELIWSNLTNNIKKYNKEIVFVELEKEIINNFIEGNAKDESIKKLKYFKAQYEKYLKRYQKALKNKKTKKAKYYKSKYEEYLLEYNKYQKQTNSFNNQSNPKEISSNPFNNNSETSFSNNNDETKNDTIEHYVPEISHDEALQIEEEYENKNYQEKYEEYLFRYADALIEGDSKSASEFLLKAKKFKDKYLKKSKNKSQNQKSNKDKSQKAQKLEEKKKEEKEKIEIFENIYDSSEDEKEGYDYEYIIDYVKNFKPQSAINT